MKFDITQTPPTTEALGAEAKTSQALLGKLKVWSEVSLAGFMVGVIAVVVCVWYIGTSPRLEAVLALFSTQLAVLFMLNERCDALRAGLDALNEFDPADCPQVLAWCQAHPELAAYQTQAANMPRSLVKGEAAAMGKWVASIASRAEQARLDEEQQRALAVLKMPMRVGAA
jgi:hypothetical protein